MLKKSLLLVAFNNMIIFPIASFAGILIDNYEVKLSFAVEDLPDTKKMIVTIIFCSMVEDIMFYTMHRFLHTTYVYP